MAGWFAGFALGMALVVLGGCTGDGRNGRMEEHVDPGVDQIVLALTGAFVAADSTEADSADSLRWHGARIWRGRDDGPWLYVEYTAPDGLLRQAVYRIRFVHGGRYAAEPYALPGAPHRFAGAWRDAEPLAGLAPDALSPREGCTVYFGRTGPGHYTGRTEGTGCAAEQPEVAYLTLDVVLDGRRRIERWERGFDADGTPVRGAPEGPTVYERVGD